MATLQQLYDLYDAYEEKAKKVRAKASRFAGAFNMGDDPRRHECHEQFYEDVGSWVAEFLAAAPDQAAVAGAVHWILETAAAHREEDVYWYLYAIHTHAKPLIPLLGREECRDLLQMYDAAYPALDRLPAQQEIYRLLKQYAGEKKDEKGKIFSFFRRK